MLRAAVCAWMDTCVWPHDDIVRAWEERSVEGAVGAAALQVLNRHVKQPDHAAEDVRPRPNYDAVNRGIVAPTGQASSQ